MKLTTNLFYGKDNPPRSIRPIALEELIQTLKKRMAGKEKPAYLAGAEIQKRTDGTLQSLRINLYIPPSIEVYIKGPIIEIPERRFACEPTLLMAMKSFLQDIAIKIDKTNSLEEDANDDQNTFFLLKEVIDSKQIMVSHCVNRDIYPESSLGLKPGRAM